MLVDQKTNEMYIPLNSLIDGQRAYLEVCMTHIGIHIKRRDTHYFLLQHDFLSV